MGQLDKITELTKRSQALLMNPFRQKSPKHCLLQFTDSTVTAHEIECLESLGTTQL